jgi:hypothetical protein
VCEPIARWLADSVSRGASVSALTRGRNIRIPQKIPPTLSDQGRRFDQLAPLPAFGGLPGGRWRMPLQLQGRSQGQPGSSDLLGMRKSTGRQRDQVLFDRLRQDLPCISSIRTGRFGFAIDG